MSISLIHTFDDDEFKLESGFMLSSTDEKTKNAITNLELKHICKNVYHTSHYCGVAKLCLKNDDEEKDAVLIVSPRFGITWGNVKTMLDCISDSEEYDAFSKSKDWKEYFSPDIDTVKKCVNSIIGDNNEESVDEQNITEFAFDIAKLYEFYCRAEIKRAEIKKALPPEWELAPYEEKKSVFAEEAQNKKLYLGGSLIPDIILTNGSDKTVILDVKFKDGSSGQSHREDRLQILAYQYMYNAPVIGHILPNCSNTSTEIKSPLNNKICDYVQLRLFPNTMKEEEFISNLKKVLEQAIEG